MLEKILLNWQPYLFKEENLPCLVTYGKNMGGSHLSITLIANLFAEGSKILFLSAYPMAKDNFLNQVEYYSSKIIQVDSLEALEESSNAQAIIIESGNATLFLNALKTLPDLNERVIFIKNIEIFNEEVFNACKNLEKVIMSGDIDACIFNGEIPKIQFKTIIAFNQPETPINIKVPKLEHWSSFLSDDKKDGILTIVNEHKKYSL